MANTDIRDYLRMHGVPLWRLADALNIHENTLGRRLRHELPAEEKERLYFLADIIVKGD